MTPKWEDYQIKIDEYMVIACFTNSRNSEGTKTNSKISEEVKKHQSTFLIASSAKRKAT